MLLDAGWCGHTLALSHARSGDPANLTLRRDTIVTMLALLVIALAIPFALVDTIETGRVYVFSRQCLEELPQGFIGPGRLRTS